MAPQTLFAFADDQCAGERYGTSIGCNANDVSITGIAVAPGTPTSCVGGTTFLADLDITINFSTPDRYDIGIFLANDGNDPTVPPTTTGGSSSCNVGILPTSFPFLDLDPLGGLDTCGDGNGTINGGAGYGVVRMADVPVQCQAIADSGGNLYIPFVVSWDQQASPSGGLCSSIADPVPGSPAKCNSPNVSNAVEVQYGTVNAVVLPEISKTNSITAVDPGQNISYTVVIDNTTGQPLSGAIFTDPATANVNVTALTCAGTACPGTYTITDMQGAGILLNTIAIGDTVTFTINATVSDPIVPSHASSISNTAFVTVQGEFNSATDSDSINGAVFSDLSTSTKSVVDLNGGEADPGDTLRYTISLIETEGNPVIGASVTDDISADINNFTVVSIPTGAIDGSNPTGGANGTGYLDITGINVAANGTEIIEFDVTIPLGTTAGALIDNTATITNVGGLGATPVAPTVPVSPSAVPQTDNKQLYLNAATMTREQTAITANTVTVTQNTPTVWTGNAPVALQIDNTIESASASLLLTADTSHSRQVEARMYCSSTPTAYATSGVYALGEVSQTTPTLYRFNLTTTNGGFSYPATCPAGDYWILEVESHTNRDVFVHTIDSGVHSRLNLDSSNIIYVENLLFYDLPYTNPSSSLITTATPGSTIYARSVISDPFGSFDVTSADIVITDPNGNPVLIPSPDAMTEVNDSNAATKTYEYAYTLPAAPVAGNYSVKVTGHEGYEGLVTDDLVSSFAVESLDLELTKTVDTATPTELGNVVYTLTVSNLDPARTATGVQVTDLLSAASLTYVDDTADETLPTATTYDSGTGIWDIGSIAPLSSITMTITAQTKFGTAGTTITNTATVTANDQYDDDTTNNADSVDIVPQEPPPLTIIKWSTAPSAKPGQFITYWIQVDHTGATPATNVFIDDTLSQYVDLGVDTYGPDSHIDFIEGVPASGLTAGADVYSQTNDTNFTYDPQSGNGGVPAGADGNITNWRFNLNGTMAAGGQFFLQYQVRVK